MSLDSFDGILQALEGEKVLLKPRVSRETILDVMREHTNLLSKQREDIAHLQDFTKEIKAALTFAQQAIVELKDNLRKTDTKLNNTTTTVNNMRSEVNDLASKINEIDGLKAVVEEQKQLVTDTVSSFNVFKTNANNYFDDNTIKVNELEAKTTEIDFKVKETRHIVDHFGDSLVLSSTQITVESSVGFSKRPMTLYDILKDVNNNSIETEKSLAYQIQRMNETAVALDSKADITILGQVQELDLALKGIQEFLKKEEDQGINAVRRTCENLTVIVEGLQGNMLDKIDRVSTELIVQKKYEDIINYLQEALQASTEDEDNFKVVAAQLEEKIGKIITSKADRNDIVPIQECLARTEASISKIDHVLRDKNKGVEAYTRADIDRLLSEKIGVESIESQINQVMKNRRGKKAAFLNEDDMSDEPRASGGPNFANAAIDDALNNALSQARNLHNTTGKQLLKSSSAYGNNGFPNNTPGVYRPPSEAGRAGGLPPGGLPNLTKKGLGVNTGEDGHDIDYPEHGDKEARGMHAMLNYSFLNSAHSGGGFNTKMPYNNKPPYMKVKPPPTYLFAIRCSSK